MNRSFAALAIVFAGCSGDLPPQSRVDKLRVLAVRASPPEVMPGQPSALDTLAAFPPGALDGGAPPSLSYLWMACLEAPGASSPTACGVSATGNGSPGLFDGDAGAGLPDCAAAPSAPLCLIGSSATASYTASDAALGGQVILTVIVADAQAGGATTCAVNAFGNGGAPTDPDHCVIALKRLTVSSSARPNQNPALDGFTLDGTPAVADPSDQLPPPGSAQTVTLDARRAAGSAEVKPDGTVEQLLVSWFDSAGSFNQTITAYQPADCDSTCMMTDPPLDATTQWTPPTVDEAAQFVHDGTIGFWAVIRDDRGGIGWTLGQGLAR